MEKAQSSLLDILTGGSRAGIVELLWGWRVNICIVNERSWWIG